MMHPTFRPLVLAAVAVAACAAQAAGQGPKWPSSSAPRPLPAHEVKFPAYELRTLANGLQVVVVRHTEQPAVSLRLIVGAGGAQDPRQTPGVAAMASTLLDQGTTSLTAQQVADRIDSAGGALDTGVGRDLSFAHVVVMKDGLSLGMDLLADVVRNPAFASEELERQRRQTLAAMQVSYEDPEYLANIVFDRLVYGFNPYGRPGNGTPESVARIGRDDLVAFHHRYFVPNNCLLAVVGDVTTDEAMEAVTKAFGSWERREVAADAVPDPPEPTRRVIVVDKPGAVQTEIRVGHLGIARKSPDYMPVDLAIKILGGEGANRLHRVLRTERGLTYSASADTETLKRSGEFVAHTNTRSEATGEVLRLIVDEYAKLRRERVNDDELSDAKAYLTGHFPLTLETPDDIAIQVLNALFYGLPLEELQTYRQRVNAVSVDDVSRVTWKYVRPDRLAIVLVGNAAAFVDQLKGLGFGKFEVVRLADLDLTAADFQKKTLADAGHPQARHETSGRGGVGVPPRALQPLSTVARGWAPPPPTVRGTAMRRSDGGPAAAYAPDAASSSQATPPVPPAAGSPQEPPARPGAGSPQAPAAAPQAAASGDSGEALIARAVAAKGGLDRLKAVKTVRATATTTVMLPQGPARTQTTTYIAYPDHFRVEAHLMTGLVVQVYAGEDDVWVQDPSKGVIEPPAQARKDFKASVDRDLIPLLIRAATGGATVRVPEAASGVQMEGGGVVEVSAPGLDPIRLYIDGKGLIVRESYSMPTGGTADELFDDYRTVGGIQIAFHASVRRNNLTVLERAVSEFAINAPLPPRLFERPTGRTPGQSPPRPDAGRRPDVAPAMAERPAPQAATPAAPTGSGAEAALGLVHKAIGARGGLERLKAVRRLRIEATNVPANMPDRVEVATTTYIEYPAKYRVESRVRGHVSVALLAGDAFQVLADGRIMPDTKERADARDAFIASARRDPIQLLTRVAAGELTAALHKPTRELRRELGLQLVAVTGEGIGTVVLGIEPQSGALRTISYPAEGAGGAQMEEAFGDFRAVEGITFPFTSNLYRDDTLVRERWVKQIDVNPPLAAQLFELQ